MTLRARWIGPPPRTGDYLMSTTRPRFAYRVVRARCPDARTRWDAVQKAEVRQLQIDVERVRASEVPSTAQVHAWKWDKREARPRRGGAHA